MANGISYPSGYYLVDGIYLELAPLVKTIPKPADDDHKRILYKQKQESKGKMWNERSCYGYQMQMYHSYPDGYTIDKSLKMSHCSMANELQRFLVLKKQMDDVIGNFLRDGLQPSKTMIGHIVEMEMDYINTSAIVIGGSKAVEMAIHQVKSSNISTTIQKQKATLAGNVMGPISLTRLQLPRMLKR
ncbi:dynamin-related protein 3A, partial [Tanacetum coccineum]